MDRSSMHIFCVCLWALMNLMPKGNLKINDLTTIARCNYHRNSFRGECCLNYDWIDHSIVNAVLALGCCVTTYHKHKSSVFLPTDWQNERANVMILAILLLLLRRLCRDGNEMREELLQRTSVLRLCSLAELPQTWLNAARSFRFFF